VETVEEERDGVALSSLDSPLGDGLEVTKRALVDHFDAVADRLSRCWPVARSR
jgi:bifunctional non-homologous end joining protein LigD